MFVVVALLVVAAVAFLMVPVQWRRRSQARRAAQARGRAQAAATHAAAQAELAAWLESMKSSAASAGEDFVVEPQAPARTSSADMGLVGLPDPEVLPPIGQITDLNQPSDTYLPD